MKKKDYAKYFYLLREDESDLPEKVKRTIDFFTSHNFWFNLTRNLEAHSCRDAVNKRKRLGHTGIPLRHELKSFFGKFINAAGNEQFVVLHCRGNQELNFDKVNEVLKAKSEVTRLSDEELAQLFELDYGLINPFTLDPLFLGLPLLQVFDESIKKINKPPYTMMTNAGGLTWGIEFKPIQLLESIQHSIVADIIRIDNYNNANINFRKQIIGIITGNAPESGILLWQRINQIIRKNLGDNFFGDISFPGVIIESIPDMGLSMELDLREQETWETLKNSIISLCQRGATIICIACNTTQYFTPEIRKITSQYKARFISIPEVTLNYLKKKKIKEFAFLGVKYVTELDKKWSAFKGLRKFKVETLSEESIKQIHDLAFKVKQEGITGAGINKLRDLLNASTKSKTIVIALTELSILLETQKKRSSKGRYYIDTLELLAEAVADEYLALSQTQ